MVQHSDLQRAEMSCLVTRLGRPAGLYAAQTTGRRGKLLVAARLQAPPCLPCLHHACVLLAIMMRQKVGHMSKHQHSLLSWTTGALLLPQRMACQCQDALTCSGAACTLCELTAAAVHQTSRRTRYQVQRHKVHDSASRIHPPAPLLHGVSRG